MVVTVSRTTQSGMTLMTLGRHSRSPTPLRWFTKVSRIKEAVMKGKLLRPDIAKRLETLSSRSKDKGWHSR